MHAKKRNMISSDIYMYTNYVNGVDQLRELTE